MIDQILKDASERPQIFVWRGPLDLEKVNAWLSHNQVNIPPDLKELWIVTGGGDIFESETLLSPLETDPSYDIEAVNRFHWQSGLDKSLLIFHVGTWISAVRNEPPHFVSFSLGDVEKKMEFKDFDAWYRQTVRREFAQRYGLED